jgi:hypothetical protein
MAKTAAKVSVVSDTAAGRRVWHADGLDYSSMTGLQFSHFGVLVTASRPSSGHDRLSQLGNGS